MAGDRYYFPEHGGTEANARQSPVDMGEASQFAAEECAADYHRNGSGWEADWPVVLVFLRDGEEPTRWIVDREMVPEFHASRQG